jgi:diguanylate cyclase (GGDEF)-like protein
VSFLLDHPLAHTEVFRSVWLARYGSLRTATEMAERCLSQAAGNERVALRMRFVLQRLAPQSAEVLGQYADLADAMLALGDRAGYLIAQSYACGVENHGGDVATALALYERLMPDINRLEDPVERHAAMGPSLLLYQSVGNVVGYMQQACRMLQLANEVDHAGLRAASSMNVGVAYYLAGDDVQARSLIEEALAGSELGGWMRFSAVGILAELHASVGDVDKVLPLLNAWAFPERTDELYGPSLAHFHTLGAEIHARLGQTHKTRAYLEFLQTLPAAKPTLDSSCMLAVARALHEQAEGRIALAQQAFEQAMTLEQDTANSERVLTSRFWWMAAEVAGVLGRWEQAYRLLDRHRQLERERKHDIAAVRRVAAQFQDDANARAVEAAQRDRLTGLGNRERLIAVGDAWTSRGLRPLVAMLNVRRFNAINEALGRDVGDAVLQAVADRLKEACVRFDHAQAGRVYADQFAVVVAGGRGEVRALRALAAEMFATPLEVAGHWVDISAAWGVALGPAHGVPMHRLMGHAEIALHEDRRTDSGWTVYEAGLVRADPRQLSLISELRRAAQNDEFVLLLQPKFRLSDNVVTSFEALIRWDHPSRGLVQPSAFIPFAEDTGSIRGITEWVLRRAMQLSARLRAAGLVSQIAVNVSVHDVGSSGFSDLLSGLLQATGARAADIRLELTEGAVMKDPATVIDRMRQVNALGIEWSVDDFGTGQSSLSYLHMLPVSELKIDRSFVRGAAGSSTTLTLLKAAIDLGRNLGLSTVGEGAETADEWALLRDLGCGTAQGWFGACPMPEHEVLAWLQHASTRAGPTA